MLGQIICKYQNLKTGTLVLFYFTNRDLKSTMSVAKVAFRIVKFSKWSWNNLTVLDYKEFADNLPR